MVALDQSDQQVAPLNKVAASVHHLLDYLETNPHSKPIRELLGEPVLLSLLDSLAHCLTVDLWISEHARELLDAADGNEQVDNDMIADLEKLSDPGNIKHMYWSATTLFKFSVSCFVENGSRHTLIDHVLFDSSSTTFLQGCLNRTLRDLE